MEQQQTNQLTEALTTFEQIRVRDLLVRDDRSIALIVPIKQDANELWENLSACCRVLDRCEKVTSRIKPVVGRMLQVLKGYPMEFFESKGYSSFGDFMQRGIREMTGASTAEGYKLLSLAEKLSTISPAAYEEIGYTKLSLVSQAAVDGDSTLPDWLEKARTNKTSDLRQMVYDAKLGIAPGSLEWASIIIQTNKDTRQQWEEFTTDPQIRAYCGTESAGAILQRMIEEVSIEWRAQAEGTIPNMPPNIFVTAVTAAVTVTQPPVFARRQQPQETRSPLSKKVDDGEEDDDGEWPPTPGEPEERDFDSVIAQ